MKGIRTLGYTLCLLGMAACTTPLKVTSDYDKQASFGNYKTFAIDTMRATQTLSQLNQRRIVSAVRAELIKKGFKESNTPDLLVHVAAILKNAQSVTATTTGYYGYGGFYRPYAWGMGSTAYTTFNVDNYTEGSLIIDIADASSKSLVWEGIGNKEIDEPLKDPDTEIGAAVAKILATFPPGRKQ
jgi:hypothetical protein